MVERVGNIDALAFGRSPLSDQNRKKQRRAKLQQQKEEGYQQLAELCYLGEYEAAQQLASKNPSWGYVIVDGVVMEKSE